MLRTDCKSWWSMWAQKHMTCCLQTQLTKCIPIRTIIHSWNSELYSLPLEPWDRFRWADIVRHKWLDCLMNTVSALPFCLQLQQSTQTGAVALFITTHSRWKLYVFAATILTADCISLVRAIGALWLAIAAPPGWNALAVLTGEVRGRACLLCCGGKYHISNTTTRGFSPFSSF